MDQLPGAVMDVLSYPDDKPGEGIHYIEAYREYVLEHYETMDLLFLFQPMQQYVPVALLYKKLRPDGKIYLKLDANYGWMDRLGAELGELSPLFEVCDVISAEARKLQRLLNKKWPWVVDYIPNGYYGFGEVPAEVSFAAKENIILTVGRIGTKEKNNEMLLEAFALAAKELPSWSLRLAGSVESGFQQYCAAFFERNPELAGRICFTGLIMDKERLKEEYRRAKLFVLTSLCEGGSPNVYSEAALQGCNVIVTDLDASGDMTGEGQFGITVPSEDVQGLAAALLELCRDEERMRENCRKIQTYIRRYFNYDKIVRRLHILLSGRAETEGRTDHEFTV